VITSKENLEAINKDNKELIEKQLKSLEKKHSVTLRGIVEQRKRKLNTSPDTNTQRKKDKLQSESLSGIHYIKGGRNHSKRLDMQDHAENPMGWGDSEQESFNRDTSPKDLIKRELVYWKVGYPKEAKVLELFANRIVFELELNKGKQQATKELLEEVKEVFNKWIRNSPFNMMLFDESQREYARKYNEYVDELKVQLSKLGEEQ